MATVTKWAFQAAYAYFQAKEHRGASDGEAKAIGAAAATSLLGNPPDADAADLDQAKELGAKLKGQSYKSGAKLNMRFGSVGGKPVAKIGSKFGTAKLWDKYCRKEFGGAWGAASKRLKELATYEPDTKSSIFSWGPAGKATRRCGKGGKVDLECFNKIDFYGPGWQRKKSAEHHYSECASLLNGLVSRGRLEKHLKTQGDGSKVMHWCYLADQGKKRVLEWYGPASGPKPSKERYKKTWLRASRGKHMK